MPGLRSMFQNAGKGSSGGALGTAINAEAQRMRLYCQAYVREQIALLRAQATGGGAPAATSVPTAPTDLSLAGMGGGDDIFGDMPLDNSQ